MKTHAPDTLEMPPGWLAEVQAVADAEHRAAAELVRDVVGRYIEERRAAQPAALHTPAEAAARIRELRKGNFLPEGETIKDLINHGRA
jgi:hypothetical protein